MMRSRTTHALLLAAFVGIAGSLAASCSDEEYVVAGAGAGGAGGVAAAGGAGGSGGGVGGGCNAACCPEDCPEPTQVCIARSCTDSGECGTTWAPAGTASPWQVEGDCRSFVCNGEGNATAVPDAGDVLDDGNECTVDACNGLSPTNTAKGVGTACAQAGGLHCNAAAECVECLGDAQCSTGLCLAGRCVPLTCENAMLDVGETGVDCGGDCGATCEAGEECQGAGDCADKVCAGGVCAAASCNDGVKNGDEADVDCGGSCATKCGPYQGCKVDGDCAGDECSGTMCIPNCQDGVRNGAETDVDCGGPGCGECNIGSDCQVGTDCVSTYCTDGKCCGMPCDAECVACAAQMTNAPDGMCAPSTNEQATQCQLIRALSITSGYWHSCALLPDASVKCWGSNGVAQLGLGDSIDRGDNPGEMGAALPTVPLGTNRTAVAVAGGRHHSCAVLDNGSVKCWGENAFYALGLGIPDFFAIVGDNPNEVGDLLPPVSLGSNEAASAVSSGIWHHCAILSAGKIKCWGANGTGQLGLGDTDFRGDDPSDMGDALPYVNLGAGSHVADVITGNGYSCALFTNATVKCWGGAAFGVLGQSGPLGDEPGEMGDDLHIVEVGSNLQVVSISGGAAHVCGLMHTGQVKCWGNNEHGQLGLNDTNNRGDDPGEMGDALPSVNLGSGRTAVAVSAGLTHTCALLDNATIRCWGCNDQGQLGLGDTSNRGDAPGEMGDALPSVDLGGGAKAISVFAGWNQTCAVLNTGHTKCWGENVVGELGLGDTNNRGDDPGEMGSNLPTVKLFSDVW